MGIFRNKNVFRNIFRLFCSWEQNSQNEIQVFWNENSSQTNAYLHYSNYSYSGLIPNERALRVVFVVILKLKLKRGLQKDTHKVWTLELFFPKNISLPCLHKMLIAKVFQTLCGWFRVSLSFLYFV